MSNQFSTTSVQQIVADCCCVRPWGTVVSKANPPVLSGAHSSAGKTERSGSSVLITNRERCALCVCVCVCGVCGVYLWYVCVCLCVLPLCIYVCTFVCMCLYICTVCAMCLLCLRSVCTHTCACGKASNVGWVQPHLDSFPPTCGGHLVLLLG